MRPYTQLWTKMDTSFWKTINTDVGFKETKKQFYGKYLWRMEIYAICADVAFDVDPEKAVALIIWQAANRSNFGGSWQQPYWHYGAQYDKVDYDLLRSIKTIKESFANIKTRIENHSMQFYSESENDLKLVAQMLTDPNCITCITGPKPGTEQLLSSNAIIAPKTPFKYKVLIRDGAYPPSVKKQLFSLLEAQEDSVKITAGVKHGFNRPYPGTWGLFFYTNDLSVTTMMSLICPGIIGKIHEVVQA